MLSHFLLVRSWSPIIWRNGSKINEEDVFGIFLYQFCDFAAMLNRIPRLVLEVSSSANGADHLRMIVYGAIVVRLGNSILESHGREKKFVLMAIYVVGLGAECYLLYQSADSHQVSVQVVIVPVVYLIGRSSFRSAIRIRSMIYARIPIELSSLSCCTTTQVSRGRTKAYWLEITPK